jgi:hypothetical protein
MTRTRTHNLRTSRQISRAIARAWRFLRHAGDNRPEEGIAVFVDGDPSAIFVAYTTEWRGDYALDAWAWFSTPREARLYVLRHLGVLLPE